MMISFTNAMWSSVGKKFVTGITGIGLCVFILEHLIANLFLFVGPDAFNRYTYKLTNLGGLLYVLEGAIAVGFAFHAVFGISVWLNKRRARPVSYTKSRSKGGPSRQTSSSVTMIYTGLLLLVFLVLHLITFKYGPVYETTVDGIVMRDLYRLVIEVFQHPSYVIGYTVIMALLGVHLRHGFWSAFQSLGINHPTYTPFIYRVGVLFAIVVGLGFLVMPIWIYYTGGQA